MSISFTIRPENCDADRRFITGLNARLCEGIDAPAHTSEQIAAFQERFTASACDGATADCATLLAIAEDGERLGYVHARSGTDEIANEQCGYIALLAVVPKAEGASVAQSLLHAAEQWSRRMGHSRISLEVFASNQRAVHFYEKSGFQPETIRMIRSL